MRVFASKPVHAPSETAAADGATEHAAATRRRRLPNPDEQARRVAWGKEWGPMVREATKHLRETP